MELFFNSKQKYKETKLQDLIKRIELLKLPQHKKLFRKVNVLSGIQQKVPETDAIRVWITYSP